MPSHSQNRCPFSPVSGAGPFEQRLAMPAVIAAPPGTPLPEGTQEKQEFTALLSRLIAEQWKIVQRTRAESTRNVAD